jgi:hypothetical protein
MVEAEIGADGDLAEDRRLCDGQQGLKRRHWTT